LTGLQFYLPSAPGAPRSYDFCLEGLAFTDGDGKEVRP